MASNKYSKDYRLLESFDKNGKVHTDYEYIGEPWAFIQDRNAVEGERKKALRYAVAAAVAFIAALLPFSGMMKKLWIALPFIFIAVPTAMTIDLLISMRRFPEPMEHRHADKLNNAYPIRTLAMVYLSGIALMAEMMFLVLYGVPSAGEQAMTFCTGAVFLCSFMLFRKRGSFRAEIAKQPVQKTGSGKRKKK